MKYYIISGEASGDLHGSNLMKGLYAQDKEAKIRFWGGDFMNSVFKEHRCANSNKVQKKESSNADGALVNKNGEGMVRNYKKGDIIGFSQVILNAGKYLRKLNDCKQDILYWQPDVVILIDYPGFNFKIAEFAHKQGFKVFYYIAPKVWASRESRIKKIKKYVDKLFIVFPFEIKYFKSKGVDFIYKGNPLIDAIDNSMAEEDRKTQKAGKNDFFSRNNLPISPSIALLPGSRKGEISSMMPTYMEFVDKLRAIPEYSTYQFIIAGAPGRTPEDYAEYIGERDKYVHLVFGQSSAIIKNCNAAVVNSGTASLETALIGTPQVVAYKGPAFNYLIARIIIRVKYISLGNLIADKFCFRELLQYYFTSDNLLSEVRRLLEDKAYKNKMLEGYDEIRELLGGKGASYNVAKAMIEEL